MALKKSNAIMSFVSALLLFAHVVTSALTKFGVIAASMLPVILGRATMIFFVGHALVSIIILFFMSGNGIAYPKLNKSTVVQRTTAIILMILVHTHVISHSGSSSLGVFGLITEILFAYFVFSHFMCSLDKGLTTLGIYRKETEIPVRVLSIIGFLCALITTVYSFFFA